MEQEKNKTARTLKTASPETLFARFLQKKAQAPTPIQLNTWEIDGGRGHHEDEDDFVVIAGMKCHTLFQRLKARASKYLHLATHH